MSGSEYVSIQTYLRGVFRPLSGPDDPAYAQLNTLPSAPLRNEFANTSPLPETVTKFLFQMDVKLDAILAGMLHSSVKEDFPHALEILSVSASGMEFTADEPLAPGDWIEVIIYFRQGGSATASGIGSVTSRKEGKDGRPVFSFSFSRILEDDREKIIGFVFKEERRQLRESRLEQE
ncbi:MAG: hypothetical protein DELT_01883 [Desulfovibrio sp.]